MVEQLNAVSVLRVTGCILVGVFLAIHGLDAIGTGIGVKSRFLVGVVSGIFAGIIAGRHVTLGIVAIAIGTTSVYSPVASVADRFGAIIDICAGLFAAWGACKAWRRGAFWDKE